MEERFLLRLREIDWVVDDEKDGLGCYCC